MDNSDFSLILGVGVTGATRSEGAFWSGVTALEGKKLRGVTFWGALEPGATAGATVFFASLRCRWYSLASSGVRFFGIASTLLWVNADYPTPTLYHDGDRKARVESYRLIPQRGLVAHRRAPSYVKSGSIAGWSLGISWLSPSIAGSGRERPAARPICLIASMIRLETTSGVSIWTRSR